MPLTDYTINWGDKIETVITGSEMYDRPDYKNTHTLYHLYNYWDLRAKDAKGEINGYCGQTCNDSTYCAGYTGPYCVIKANVKIKDDWGWCSEGFAFGACGSTCDEVGGKCALNKSGVGYCSVPCPEKKGVCAKAVQGGAPIISSNFCSKDSECTATEQDFCLNGWTEFEGNIVVREKQMILELRIV